MAFGSSQIDTGGAVGLGLRGLGMVPGPIGLVGTLASLGMRGNNLGYSNRARRSWGQEDLGFGQTLGGLAGLNSYGAGGQRDKLGEYGGVDVTPSGMSSRGGFLGIGAEPVGAYTPGEAQRRNAASLYGNSFGTPRPGAVTPTPARAAPASVPSPARAVASRDAFDMSRFNDDADPIGAAIRSMTSRGDVGRGGSSGGGGGGGRSSGGGRSDRSSMSSGRG